MLDDHTMEVIQAGLSIPIDMSNDASEYWRIARGMGAAFSIKIL
jgi:hypothetical protein